MWTGIYSIIPWFCYFLFVLFSTKCLKLTTNRWQMNDAAVPAMLFLCDDTPNRHGGGKRKQSVVAENRNIILTFNTSLLLFLDCYVQQTRRSQLLLSGRLSRSHWASSPTAPPAGLEHFLVVTGLCCVFVLFLFFSFACALFCITSPLEHLIIKNASS